MLVSINTQRGDYVSLVCRHRVLTTMQRAADQHSCFSSITSTQMNDLDYSAFSGCLSVAHIDLTDSLLHSSKEHHDFHKKQKAHTADIANYW